MTALVATVFLASLTGSLHCAGMCGAFVLFAVGEGSSRTRGLYQVAYHGGRLITYCLLGVIAGALGSAIDLGGAAFGVRHGAMMLAGAAMIAFGVIRLLQSVGFSLRPGPVPAMLGRLYRPLYERARRLPGASRPLAVGLASTLLPCGWLYAFVVTAAGTGSAVRGALAMAVFWAGTVPVLALVAAGVQRLAGPLRRRLPALAALAIIVVGAAALVGRAGIAAPDELGAAPSCHTGEVPVPAAGPAEDR